MFLLLCMCLIFNNIIYAGEVTEEQKKANIQEINKKMNEAKAKAMQALQGAVNAISPDAIYNKYKSKPEVKPNLVSPTKERVYGNKNARNKIVVFSDYACGHCKVASKELKKRVDENKQLVNVTYVFFPLDIKCNPYTTGKLSDYSCLSTKLALCGEKQGHVWKTMDFLYDNQQLGNARPMDSAFIVKKMESQLKLKDVEKCLNSKWLENRLKQENEVYKNLKIPGTPYIILNERQLGNVFKSQKSFTDFIKYLDLKEHPKRK